MMTTTERRKLALEVRKSRTLTREWMLRYQDGDRDAGGVLCSAHYPAIYAMARRYVRPGSRDWLDAVQQGRIGLLHGIARHDLRSENHPLTYVLTWVRHFINRWLIECGQGVRVPTHRYDAGGGKAASASIWRPKTRLFCEQPDFYHEDIEHSFEEALTDDSDPVDEVLSEEDRRRACRAVVRWLSARLPANEIAVLFDRFRSKPRTLKAIGDEMGLSRERIRQIEEAGIARCQRLLPAVGSSGFDAWLSLCLAHAQERPRAIGMAA